jgi:hypothetical protein
VSPFFSEEFIESYDFPKFEIRFHRVDVLARIGFKGQMIAAQAASEDDDDDDTESQRSAAATPAAGATKEK